MRKKGFRIALASASFAALVACGAPQDQAAQAPVCPTPDAGVAASASVAITLPPPPQSKTSLDPEERKQLFKDLVARVHEIHVFSRATKKNLGLAWDKDEVPALEKELDDADSLDKLSVALTHFVNSLHDMHCRYRPPSRGQVVRLRVKLGVEWKGTDPQFFVAEIGDKSITGLEVGDIVEEIDGIAAKDLVRAHHNVTSFNNWPQIALGVSRFLTYRRTAETLTRDGDVSKWVVRSRKNGDKKNLELGWKARKDEERPDDSWVDYANEDCGQTDPARYEGYKLAARGYRYCLYTADKPPRSFYPIVRQVSFRYFDDEGPQAFLADHDSLAFRLGLLKQAKGVVLDMRENGGGNDPNSFLDWWAPARTYTDTYTMMRVTQLVTNAKEMKELVVNTPQAVTDFYIACMKKTPSAAFCARRPFMCKADTCDWDNKFTPSHQVTKLPVALAIGPGCGSSCDSFALTWKKNAFGPIVGMPSMAGYTTNRYRAPVPSRIPMGTFDLAFSYDVLEDGTEIEGVPIEPDITVHPTFENYAKYDTLVVDAAIAVLSPAKTPINLAAPKKPDAAHEIF